MLLKWYIDFTHELEGVISQTIHEHEARALKIRIAERWVELDGVRANAMSKALYKSTIKVEAYGRLVQRKIDELEAAAGDPNRARGYFYD